jgi:hypothetical protein
MPNCASCSSCARSPAAARHRSPAGRPARTPHSLGRGPPRRGGGRPAQQIRLRHEAAVLPQNLGELHNLAIRRGTLTEEDRFQINDHIVQTYIMLKGLPWPPGLEQVPSWPPRTTSAWTAKATPAPPANAWACWTV